MNVMQGLVEYGQLSCKNNNKILVLKPKYLQFSGAKNRIYKQCKDNYIGSSIIDIDMEAVVNSSDYLIVNWDKSVFRGGGTHGEITLAYFLKKPIYLVNHVPFDDLSSWIFSCSTEVFDSFEDLKTHLTKKYK